MTIQTFKFEITQILLRDRKNAQWNLNFKGRRFYFCSMVKCTFEKYYNKSVQEIEDCKN